MLCNSSALVVKACFIGPRDVDFEKQWSDSGTVVYGVSSLICLCELPLEWLRSLKQSISNYMLKLYRGT